METLYQISSLFTFLAGVRGEKSEPWAGRYSNFTRQKAGEYSVAMDWNHYVWGIAIFVSVASALTGLYDG